MFCNKCGREVPNNATRCPDCGTVFATEHQKGMPKAVKVILILLVVGIGIGIITGITYNPVRAVKNGHFPNMKNVTVGEMFDDVIDDTKWYSKFVDGNTLVYCDGTLFDSDVSIALVKDDDGVKYLSDMLKVNGKTVSESETVRP